LFRGLNAAAKSFAGMKIVDCIVIGRVLSANNLFRA